MICSIQGLNVIFYNHFYWGLKYKGKYRKIMTDNQLFYPTEELIKDANAHKDYNCSYIIPHSEDGREMLFCSDAGGKE